MEIELIDREAAIEKMCGDCKSGYDGHCPHPFGMCQEYESILQVPSIKSLPVRLFSVRRGRWEKHEDYLDYCTICGAVISLPHHKFCGNCGAKNEKG